VHAFVLRLLEERADPTAIAFHATQGTQMLQGPSDHAWHGSNRFQDNGTVTISFGEERVGEESQKPGKSISNPIGEVLWVVVSLK
jgi:hypothetical protein